MSRGQRGLENPSIPCWVEKGNQAGTKAQMEQIMGVGEFPVLIEICWEKEPQETQMLIRADAITAAAAKAKEENPWS